jgi:hypothetical protein
MVMCAAVGYFGVMPIPSGSSIGLKTKDVQWTFRWTGFDLDDCFDSFQIRVMHGGAQEDYDLGPCAVHALRQLTRVFESNLQEDAAGGGFRNPDPRFYELRKRGEAYNLIIRFPEQGMEKQFDLVHPEVSIDRKFLSVYEGREA